MVDPYLGEIKLMAFQFAPQGWALCQGQILSISQNSALFSLLGTSYGGNGTANFGLPDLQGRAAGDLGPNLYTVLGLKMGSEQVTILSTEYPMHTHTMSVNSSTANIAEPGSTAFLGSNPSTGSPPNIYTPAQGAALQPIYNGSTNPVLGYAAGGSQPHENMQPYLVMNYSIAMTGVYPTRG